MDRFLAAGGRRPRRNRSRSDAGGLLDHTGRGKRVKPLDIVPGFDPCEDRKGFYPGNKPSEATRQQ